MTTAREDTSRLADLLRREHDALADFLVALAAFDHDRRWVELGYSSLFSFLVRELGLSKGAAFYRNRAADLVQKFPEIIEPLRDGRLCLSSVAELSNVLTSDNAREVLPRFFHLSRSEAKEVTAELKPDPAPPLRTVITTVPSPAAASPTVREGFPGNLLHANSAVPDVVPRPAMQARKRVEVEPLTAELRRVHLTSDRELVELLAAARDALAHSHPGASDDAVIKVGLRLVIDRHRKRRGIGAKPRRKKTTGAAAEASGEARPPASPPPPPPTKRSRHVPPDVWRAVWARDGGCCSWPLENGGVCGSTYKLELDHLKGFALGAGTTADETRILCRPHQVLHERQLYGDDLVDRYTSEGRGSRCSEPVAVYRLDPGLASACAT